MSVNGVDIEPSFAFYCDAYHGKLPQDEFDDAMTDALADVEWRIFPHADLGDESTVTACKMAVCAVDELLADPGRRVTRYTAGKVSETFEQTYSMTSEAAVLRYLGGLGVLKRGRWV